jgi:uncharacterized protein YndB with AHSA1/START domain
MTRPTDNVDAVRAETLVFEVDLHHAPAKVWRALTDPVLLAEWLLPAVGFHATPGTEFKLTAPPQPGWDGVVNCRMLDIETHRKLSWRWIVGDIDTVVTFTLAPTATGTQLTIVQSGFKEHQKRNLNGARYGWKMMSEKLVELLARTTSTEEDQ